MNARRRRMRRRVGHFEHARRESQLASRGQVGGRLADGNDGVAADDMHVHIGVTQQGKAVDRPQHATGHQRFDRQTIVGKRRAAVAQGFERRIHGDDDALKRTAEQVLVEPVTHLRLNEDRPYSLEGIDRHAGAGDTGGHPDIAAGEIRTARHGDADAGVADIAFVDREVLLGCIVMSAKRDAVKNQRLARCAQWAEHDRAAADLELPHAARFLRRFDLAEQRDAVATGQDLERHSTGCGSQHPSSA